MSLVNYSPYDRALFRGFSSLFDDFDRLESRLMTPYWRNLPVINQLSVGNALGEMENTQEKFGVKVDVSQFKPEELKVDLVGNELTIQGHHEERSDQNGTIQRSFVRKYMIPKDTNLDSLRSSLSKEGHLSIEAPKKKTADGPQPRAITIEKN